MTDKKVPLSKVRKNAFAGAIGNVMEWYDFAAYAYMAPVLSGLFFPSGDDFTSLLAAYGAFAAGYLSRPLGALMFGYIGDKRGRKLVLVVSVTVMGISTVAIGLLPDATQIGPLAAVALVTLRVLQGFPWAENTPALPPSLSSMRQPTGALFTPAGFCAGRPADSCSVPAWRPC